MPRRAIAVDVEASCDAAFDLIHDYDRRLAWDTMLRDARLLDGATRADKGVRSRCAGRWRSLYLALVTEYVSFDRGRVAAIRLTDPLPFFAQFAASIRHAPLGEERSRVTYLYSFRARPRWLAWLLEPIMDRILAGEVEARLRGLARYLASASGEPLAAGASPFVPVLRDAPPTLRAALRQILLPDDSHVRLRAQLDRVWHRPWLKPVLHVSAAIGLLFPESGTGVPATLEIDTHVDPTLGVMQTWRRRFELGRGRSIDARVFYDRERGMVIERLGSTVGLDVEWCVAVLSPSRIEIRSGKVWMRVGNLSARLPGALFPLVRVVDTAGDEPDALHVSFVASHALLGRFWEYEGTYRPADVRGSAP